MAGSLRSGGFGSPSLSGPFQTNSGGFGQYAQGGTAEDTAYLDKLEAEIAWQNGELADASYIGALQAYVNATEEGTTSRARAVDDLNDTVRSIERNKAVNKVNSATTTSTRLSALHALLRLDRSHLRSMNHDNEQYREQLASIRSLQVDIRTTRWTEVVERYNRDQMSAEELERHALALAAQARGSSDEQEYLERASTIRDDILKGELSDLIEDWNDEPNDAKAKAVRAQYRKMRSRVGSESPAGEQLEEGLADFEQAVKAQAEQDEHERASLQHQHGTLSDEGWLDHLRRRVSSAEPGSRERIRRRDDFLSESYSVSESRLRSAVEAGTAPATDLIDLYESSLAVMDLDSSQAIAVQQKVAMLRAGAFDAPIDIEQSAAYGDGYSAQPFAGHMVYSTSQASAYESATGFVSQHDGSVFASTNCGMAASAMLAWAVTDGKVRVTGGEMRAYSGDTEAGTWVDDMVLAMGQLGIGAKQFTGMAFNHFHKKIAKGQPAVLTGWVGNIPPQYRQGSYTKGHSIYVDRVREKDGEVEYFVLDPSGRAGYSGMWWPAEVLQAFGWENGGAGVAGSAVFAGKRGNVKKVNIKPPPFQAFDTDYRGLSTLGKGGGATRKEAGPRRDWSDGKPVRKRGPRTGTDDDMVASFLEAVGNVERRASDRGFTMEPDPLDEARVRRARTLLERNDGDPRLAAIEWFTGQQPEKVVKDWSQTERWYANSVGRALGHKKLMRKDVVGEKPYDPLASVGDPETTPYDPPSSVSPPRKDPSGLNPNLEEMVDGILTRLGITPTAERERILGAWISAQTGDATVEGNNPLALMSNGTNDLEGQYGKLDDGRAIFGSLEDGLDAAAAAILEDAPQLIGPLRKGDAEDFVRTLEGAGWSDVGGYGSAVAEAYNAQSGPSRLIARLGRALNTPATLGAATERVSELSELMDVNPADPIQRSWFDGNRDRAFEAAMDGASTWRYQTPDGRWIMVEASSSLTRDILDIDVHYVEMTAPLGHKGDDIIDKAHRERMALGAELAFEEAAGYMESAMARRNQAILRLDWTGAFNIEQNARMMLNAVTGQGPLETPDVSRLKEYEWVSDAQRTKYTGWVEDLEPRVMDATSEFHNERGGSAIGGWLLTDQAHVTMTRKLMPEDIEGPPAPTGLAAEVGITAEMFVSMDPVTGKPIIHDRVSDRAAFEPTTELDPAGNSVVIPLYQSADAGGYIPVRNGAQTFMQPVERITEPWLVLGRQRFEGPDRLIDERTSQGESGGTALDSPFDPSRGLLEILTGADGLTSSAAVGSGQPAATDAKGPAKKVDPFNSSMVDLGRLDPANVPQWKISFKDWEGTGETMTWVSLDRQTWLGFLGSPMNQKPPMVVITPGSGLESKPGETPGDPAVLEFYGEAWAGQRPASEVFHFFGTHESDFPLGRDGDHDIGAPGGDFFIREVQIGDAPGARLFDVSLTPQERYRAGDMSYNELITVTTPFAGRPDLDEYEATMDTIEQQRGGYLSAWVGSTPTKRDTPETLALKATMRTNLEQSPFASFVRSLTGGTMDKNLVAATKSAELGWAAERAAATATLAEAAEIKATPTPTPKATPTPTPEPTPKSEPKVSPAPKAGPIGDTKEVLSPKTPSSGRTTGPFLQGGR